MVDMVGTFGLEYNDNINTSEVAPIEDVILQPGLSFGLKWQINEDNELDANLGLEYWYYLTENDLNDFSNQVGVTPDTELSFRVLVGDVTLRFYDRLQYSFDAADSVVVNEKTGKVTDRDPEAFNRFRNILGVQTEWFIGETVFSAQLSREDVYSPEDIFEYVNRYEYKAALNIERDLAANFTTGLGISYATVDFDLDVNNDGDTFTLGPWVEWQLTNVIDLYAGLAYNDYDFDSGALTDNSTFFGDDSKEEDYTWMLRLRHTANDVFKHQMEWYRAISVSNTANFNTIDGLRYSFTYEVTSRIQLDGAVGYEENESSGGLLNDDFDRWIYGLSTEVVLGPQLTADIGYRYIDKNSSASFQSYEQNQFRIFLKYDF